MAQILKITRNIITSKVNSFRNDTVRNYNDYLCPTKTKPVELINFTKTKRNRQFSTESEKTNLLEEILKRNFENINALQAAIKSAGNSVLEKVYRNKKCQVTDYNCANNQNVPKYAPKLKRVQLELYKPDKNGKQYDERKCHGEPKRADDLFHVKKGPKKLPKFEPLKSECPAREKDLPTYVPKLKRLKPLYDDLHMAWRHQSIPTKTLKSERMDDIRGYRIEKKRLPAYLKSSNEN